MKLVQLTCPRCGASLEVDAKQDTQIKCPYCRTSFFVDSEKQEQNILLQTFLRF